MNKLDQRILCHGRIVPSGSQVTVLILHVRCESTEKAAGLIRFVTSKRKFFNEVAKDLSEICQLAHNLIFVCITV